MLSSFPRMLTFFFTFAIANTNTIDWQNIFGIKFTNNWHAQFHSSVICVRSNERYGWDVINHNSIFDGYNIDVCTFPTHSVLHIYRLRKIDVGEYSRREYYTTTDFVYSEEYFQCSIVKYSSSQNVLNVWFNPVKPDVAVRRIFFFSEALP